MCDRAEGGNFDRGSPVEQSTNRDDFCMFGLPFEYSVSWQKSKKLRTMVLETMIFATLDNHVAHKSDALTD